MIEGNKLQADVSAFLTANYIFRDINLWYLTEGMKITRHYTIRRNEDLVAALDNSPNPTMYITDNSLNIWEPVTKKSISFLAEQFVWTDVSTYMNVKESVIEAAIQGTLAEIEFKPIVFDSKLTEVIKEGSSIVTTVHCLSQSDPLRVNIPLTVGDKAYFCRSRKRPNIVYPCYILNASEADRIHILYFITSQSKDGPVVEEYRTITVQANELGLTPEQAVAHTY